MKKILLVASLFLVNEVQSQDTIYSNRVAHGGRTCLVVENGDTVALHFYKDGSLASRMKTSVTEPRQLYTRYYPNGTLMWEKELENGKANGITSYYDEKGKLAGRFTVNNDAITDTLFLSPKKRLLLGEISYSSTIYGGMLHEDGTSNVSRVSGSYMYQSFYSVQLDSTSSTQKIYKEFITDQYGQFYFCLEPGEYGFFPVNYAPENVYRSSACPDPRAGMSDFGAWNLRKPLAITASGIYTLKLHYSSEAYAP